MKREKTPEEIQSIISKEDLENLYFKEDKTKEEISLILGICSEALNKIFIFYNIPKKQRKYKSPEWLLNNIDIEEFKKYYNNHSIIETAKYYGTNQGNLGEFCKKINFIKSKENINECKRKSLSKYSEKTFQKYLDKISKETFYQLHIIEDKTQEEISNIFGISKDIIYRLIKYYDIHRDRKSIYNKVIKQKEEEFGGAQEYREHFLKVREENWIKKYGSLKNLWEERQGKIEATNIKNLGVPHALSNANVKHKQSKSAKKSSLETRFEEFLINNKLNYIHGYMIEGTPYNHEFDFAIFNSQGNLDILIDCDGRFYHGYETDEDGKKVNTYIDDYRSSLIPEGVKFLICLEGEEEKAYKEVLYLINIDYDQYIQDVFNWCREIEFPYPKYKDKILENSYSSLLKSDTNKFSMNARYGMKIIDHFHSSVWKANKKGYLSPYNAWKDDNLLLKSIKNRIIYKGCNLDRSKVLAGFSIAKVAPKISLFNPNLAKYIINKYLSQYDEIFDPCSGYSGRMLGVCSLGKKYIGQDINPVTVEESNEIIKYFNLNSLIECKDSLNCNGKYECLFTCTPYGDKENWNQEIGNKSCDEWIDEILNRYDCKEYIFVVDKTEKYSQYIVEELDNKSHFNNNKEYIIKILK